MNFDAAINAAGRLMWSWTEWKLFLERTLAFTVDSMHVVAGVVILLAAALIARRPISSWRPWLLVLFLTILNEFSDLSIERWPQPERQYGESAKDILLTMALPTLLLICVRRFPQLFISKPRSR